jgi:hypothetical protein
VNRLYRETVSTAEIAIVDPADRGGAEEARMTTVPSEIVIGAEIRSDGRRVGRDPRKMEPDELRMSQV